MRLLIVEDEYHLAEVLQKGLKEDGYAVDTINNGEEALDLATVIEYDLIILDLMLPVKSRLEVLRKLRARIRALFRRKLDESNNVLKVDDLVLDTIIHKVTRAGKDIELTFKEYSVLEYLMKNRGQVLSRTEIEEHVWDYRYGSNSNIVDVYIRYLRKKTDKDFDKKLIETVRGRGYRLKVVEK